MESESNSAPPVPPEQNAPQTTGLSRRAMLRAGAAASPVLLTLASGPVSAGGATACQVASSFVSVATFKSRNPDSTLQCSSTNIEYWVAQAALPSPPADMLKKVKNILGSTASTYNGSLVKNILSGTIYTSTSLGVLQHILALALSINGGFVPNPGFVNVAYLKGVWSSYITNGPNYKSPTGLVMTEAQLITWLRVMMYPLP